MREIIISDYDYMFSFTVYIDGCEIDRRDAYAMVREYKDIEYGDSECYKSNISLFMEKYSCNRLILCIDGDIEIYVR